MKALDIFKSIGAAALSTHPLGAAALGIVNAFLPTDKKLPVTATGEQALQVVEQMSGTERASIEIANIQLEQTIAETDAQKYEAMCKADGQETRAKVVVMAMWTQILVSIIFIISVVYVYATEGAELAFSFEMAAVFLTVVATPAYVIRAYYGDLKSETKSRHNALNRMPEPVKGLAGLITAIRHK